MMEEIDSIEYKSTHSSEFELSALEGDRINPGYGFVEERLRVDRRKLEQMLQGGNSDEENEVAERFFKRVMDETDTQISWPTKLKIGAKSKKDPHVKIIGKPEAVSKAREQILEVMDTKRKRVTLKMDVSYTDHSYIIGKGGHNIQQVMEDTGCHIHFPDSNRNNLAEKSNQVSIAGQPAGVERARSRIRELLPMVLSFELPLGNFHQPILDSSSSALQMIQQTYGFTVNFRQRIKSSTTTVVVRSCRKHITKLRQGLPILMDYLTGASGTVLPVTLTMEIAPQHHNFVMGRGGINIHFIMQQTGVMVTFPEQPVLTPLQSPPLPTTQTQFNAASQRKTTVVITGHFDGVYSAWVELMSCLPLSLMFDLKEGQEIDTVRMTKLMEQLNVNIVVKPKPKHNTKCVVVRGAERNSWQLFEVRRGLLGLDSNELSLPDKTSFSLASAFLLSLGSGLQEQLLREIKEMQNSDSCQLLANLLAHSSISNGTVTQSSNQPLTAALLPHLLNQLSSNNTQYSLGSGLCPGICNNWRDLDRVPTPSENDSSCSHSSISSPSPRQSPVDKNLTSLCCGSVEDLSRYPSGLNKVHFGDFTQSCWCDQKTWKSSQESLPPSRQTKDDSVLERLSASYLNTMSPIQSSKDNTGLSQGSLSIGSVGCERKVGLNNNLPSADYEGKKLLATKAMQEPLGTETRVPTSAWSGFGFSKSMPESLIKDKLRSCGILSAQPIKLEGMSQNFPQFETSVWSPASSANTQDMCVSGATGGSHCSESVNYEQSKGASKESESAFSFSNFFDGVLQRSLPKQNSFVDLPHLLSHLELGKYVDIFQRHEIDLQTFLTMNDNDLQQLGIAYGARRKMFLAISDLNSLKYRNERSFQAAPGAERRAFHMQSPAKSSLPLVDPCW